MEGGARVPPFTMEFESVGNMGWNGDFMLEMSTRNVKSMSKIWDKF